MSASDPRNFNRRAFLGTATAAAAAALSAPAWAQGGIANMRATSTEMDPNVNGAGVLYNISSFRAARWQDYFSNTRNGVILVDTTSRCLHFWSEDTKIYKLYPTSVPMSPDLTRLGRTRVVRKQKDPSWAPTPAMKQRDPSWPDFIGPGPDNPLGPRALYLSWQYYLIHGTQDTRKIGRRSSNGCIGLYNQDILELYKLAKVGTQVLLI